MQTCTRLERDDCWQVPAIGPQASSVHGKFFWKREKDQKGRGGSYRVLKAPQLLLQKRRATISPGFELPLKNLHGNNNNMSNQRAVMTCVHIFILHVRARASQLQGKPYRALLTKPR